MGANEADEDTGCSPTDDAPNRRDFEDDHMKLTSEIQRLLLKEVSKKLLGDLVAQIGEKVNQEHVGSAVKDLLVRSSSKEQKVVDRKLANLLDSVQMLESYGPAFARECICFEDLKLLSFVQLKELVPTMGPRTRLIHKLAELGNASASLLAEIAPNHSDVVFGSHKDENAMHSRVLHEEHQISPSVDSSKQENSLHSTNMTSPSTSLKAQHTAPADITRWSDWQKMLEKQSRDRERQKRREQGLSVEESVDYASSVDILTSPSGTIPASTFDYSAKSPSVSTLAAPSRCATTDRTTSEASGLEDQYAQSPGPMSTLRSPINEREAACVSASMDKPDEGSRLKHESASTNSKNDDGPDRSGSSSFLDEIQSTELDLGNAGLFIDLDTGGFRTNSSSGKASPPGAPLPETILVQSLETYGPEILDRWTQRQPINTRPDKFEGVACPPASKGVHGARLSATTRKGTVRRKVAPQLHKGISKALETRKSISFWSKESMAEAEKLSRRNIELEAKKAVRALAIQTQKSRLLEKASLIDKSIAVRETKNDANFDPPFIYFVIKLYLTLHLNRDPADTQLPKVQQSAHLHGRPKAWAWS